MSGSSSIDEIVLNTPTTDVFIRKLMTSLILATKASNEIPKGEDYEYLRIFEKFADASAGSSEDISALLLKICEWSLPEKRFAFSEDITEPRFYEQITDVIDILLARADVLMDGTSQGSKLAAAVRDATSLDKQRILDKIDDNTPKPQIVYKFLEDIDNSRSRAFHPRLGKEQFHKAKEYKFVERSIDSSETDTIISAGYYFSHPYESELMSLHSEDCVNIAEVNALKPTLPSHALPYEFVDTEAAFINLLEELQEPSIYEIAVDLEHHSVRSFQGLTCLMQLTTRRKDYVVDTLTLRLSLHRLGVVFANPKVVKIFHGCEKDILWLQKDCGLYVVNCFDTHCAAKELKYPALSLAHLIQYHCGVAINKKHQLSDWRERPLSDEMIQYAKTDTHYLLYIFDCMRKELLLACGAAGLENVFDNSKKLCLSRYEKEAFNPTGYMSLFTPAKAEQLGSDQHAALTALWDWRDSIARDEDESAQYIMSNAELVRLGTTLPLAAAKSTRNASQEASKNSAISGRNSDTTEDELVVSAMNRALEDCAPLTPITRKFAKDIVQVVLNALSLAPTTEIKTSSSSSSSLASSSSSGGMLLAATKGSRSASAGTISGSGTERSKSITAVTFGTVLSFTPAVLPGSIISGNSNAADESSVSGSVGRRASGAGGAGSSGSDGTNNKNNRNSGGSADNSSPAQLFIDAGWRTPSKSAVSGEVYSFSPFSFEGLRTADNLISEDNKQRLSRSKEQLSIAVASRTKFDACLNELASSSSSSSSSSTGGVRVGSNIFPSVSASLESKGSNSSGGSDEQHDITGRGGEGRGFVIDGASVIAADEGAAPSLTSSIDRDNANIDVPVEIDANGNLLNVPRSLSQIYELSQRSRQRNKDKRWKDGSPAISIDTVAIPGSGGVKRSHDGYPTSSAEDPAATLALIDSLSNPKNKIEDTSVDSTLKFATEIGWIGDSQQAEAMKEAHLKEVAYQHQQQQQGGDGAMEEDSLNLQSTGTGNHGGNRSSAPQAPSTSAFDYSKLDSAVGSAGAFGMGAGLGSSAAAGIGNTLRHAPAAMSKTNSGGANNNKSGSNSNSNGGANGNGKPNKNKYGKPKVESAKNPYLHGGSLKHMMDKNNDD